MVLAFAGDSTMTRFLAMKNAGGQNKDNFGTQRFAKVAERVLNGGTPKGVTICQCCTFAPCEKEITSWKKAVKEKSPVAGPGSGGRKLYLESYGCQMNFSDSEIVASIMADAGYQTTRDADDADLVLLNTCAIRDNAEQRVRNAWCTSKATRRRIRAWWWGCWGAWPSVCATSCSKRRSSSIWLWAPTRIEICPTSWTKWREAKRRSTSCSLGKRPTRKSALSVSTRAG